MSAPAPTLGRVVILHTDFGLSPAIVTYAPAGVGGAVHCVALSHEWPLSAARVFRNVPALETLPAGTVYEAAWSWPQIVPPSRAQLAEMSRGRELVGELEAEQVAFAKALARFAERLDASANAAEIRAARYDELAERVAALERIAFGASPP